VPPRCLSAVARKYSRSEGWTRRLSEQRLAFLRRSEERAGVVARWEEGYRDRRHLQVPARASCRVHVIDPKQYPYAGQGLPEVWPSCRRVGRSRRSCVATCGRLGQQCEGTAIAPPSVHEISIQLASWPAVLCRCVPCVLNDCVQGGGGASTRDVSDLTTGNPGGRLLARIKRLRLSRRRRFHTLHSNVALESQPETARAKPGVSQPFPPALALPLACSCRSADLANKAYCDPSMDQPARIGPTRCLMSFNCKLVFTMTTHGERKGPTVTLWRCL
jgi:hypothetical protein